MPFRSSKSAPGEVLRWSRPSSPDQEAIIRLRLAAAVSLIAELILPVYQTVILRRPDWLTILIQAIWLACTVALLIATWSANFLRIWKPATLIFATLLILSSGLLSIKGASPAPFLFLLVLLPVGGTCLPWETRWQAGMSAICIVFGTALASQLEWRDSLVVSGLSAMVAAILGAHLVNEVLTRQRESIQLYLGALVRSESKFRQIFETSGSWIGIYSLIDGHIVDVNPAWEAIFGYSRRDAIGRLLTDLDAWPDPRQYMKWIESLKDGGAGSSQTPVVWRGRQGNVIHTVCSWSTLQIDGQPCVLAVGQDVTDRVAAEEELRRNREAMANQERLTAVGELASGIAHDLNNSLNALRLHLELLCGEQQFPDRYRERLGLLSRIVGDASATIGRLQDFARRRHDRPVAAVDLKTVIDQSVEMVHSTLEEKTSVFGGRIRIVVDLPGLPAVLGEPVELRQIFVNLLLNAHDAMPRGGAVRIAAKAADNGVVVTVEDEGCGIPPENLNRIFDPFFTTKGERGSGLGLAVAYGAMARLGGSISAGNRAEGGAIFTLRFPLSQRDIGRDNTPVSQAQIRPRRVMVIDDDRANLDALKGFLEARGHRVSGASSGAVALKELMHSECPVDVVFCDLGMPEINGWDIARRVKSRSDPPLFFLFTGWAQEIHANDPRRRWVDAIVAKPVEPELLDKLMAGAPAP